MKNLLKISMALLLVFTTSSCFFDGVKGNGNVMTKNRKVSSDFIKVKASHGLDVFITDSNNFSLVVEADENLHELIETKVYDGTLYISAKRNIWDASSKKILLSVSNLNEIVATSGVEVASENTLKGKNMKIVATSGAEVDLKIDANNVECSTSSGADLNLEGRAENLMVSSSSGSDVDAYKLTVDNCEANASSGSHIKVNVSDTFRGNSSSGGDIQYKGNPEIIKKSENSSGSIQNV